MPPRLAVTALTLAIVMSLSPASPGTAAEPDVTLSGTVLDDAGGGLSGVAVVVPDDSGDDDASTYTGADGRYSLTVPRLAREQVRITFSRGDDWSTSGRYVQFRDGITEANAQLSHYGTVTGRLLPAAGARSERAVILGVDVSYRDEDLMDGDAYVFEHVPPGRYHLTFVVDKDEKRIFSDYGQDGYQERQVVVRPGEHVVLEDQPMPYVAPRGRLTVEYPIGALDGSVKPLVYDDRSLRPIRDEVSTSRPYEGHLDLYPGTYRVSTGTAAWFGGSGVDSATAVTVRAGRTTIIQAPPVRPLLDVTGSIVDEQGEPVPNLTVEGFTTAVPGERMTSSITSGLGYFDMKAPKGGTYTIRVSDGTGVFEPQTFTLPAVPVYRDRYVVKRAASYGAKYEGPRTASAEGRELGDDTFGGVCFLPVNDRTADSERFCSDTDDRRYTIDGIKPGAYRVWLGVWRRSSVDGYWLGGPSRSTAQIVTFADGERKVLDLLPPQDRGTLSQLVEDSNGGVPYVVALVYPANDPDAVITTERWAGGWNARHLPVDDYKVKLVDPTGRLVSQWVGGSSFATADTFRPKIKGVTRLLRARLLFAPRQDPEVLEPEMPGTPEPEPPGGPEVEPPGGPEVEVPGVPETEVPRGPEPQLPSPAEVLLTAIVAPRVSGTAKVGRRLTSTTGRWSRSGLRYKRQWYRNGKRINGATRSTYKIKRKDAGRRLSITITARPAAGGTAASSSSARTKKVRR